MNFDWIILLKYLEKREIFEWSEQKCLERLIGHEKFQEYMYYQNKKLGF